MKRIILPSACLAIALLATTPVSAEDGIAAEVLFDQNCTQCHGDDVYTRTDRRVHSLDALRTQVRMCEQNLGLRWFDDEVDAVANLLNEQYYQFSN